MNKITDETVLFNIKSDSRFFNYIATLVTIISEIILKENEDVIYREMKNNINKNEFQELFLFVVQTETGTSDFVPFTFKTMKQSMSAASNLLEKYIGSDSNLLLMPLLITDNLETNSSIDSIESFISDTQFFFDMMKDRFKDAPEIISFINTLKGQ